MTKPQKIWSILFVLILLVSLFLVVLKPFIVAQYIHFAKKHARGIYTCTLDKEGQHVGRLYKIVNGEKKLEKTTTSNSCIFTRPAVNAGFFVFAIGGGGGATPYENGNAGEIISKHKMIPKSVIVIKVGKGGHGTSLDTSGSFVDAKDGAETVIEDLGVTAKGGFKSTRMTPRGTEPDFLEYHIPEKYHYLYDIPKSAKYGAGGQFNKYQKGIKNKAQSGHSGAVIILW